MFQRTLTNSSSLKINAAWWAEVDLPGKVKAEVKEREDEALPRGVQAGGHLDAARLDQGVAQLRKPLQHTLT